jgi:hypothetical protein
MNTQKFEYYVIDRTGDQAYPLVHTADDSLHTKRYMLFNKENEIPNPEVMEFVFGNPIPRKPVISNYFAQSDSIVSQKY